jgi:hypothetical protein
LSHEKIAAVGLAAALILGACGGDDDSRTDTTSQGDATTTTESTTEATTTTTEQLDPVEATLQRIESLTDCNALQREFDIASENFDRVEAGSPQAEASLEYMEAADARLQELECY